jgi:hypothetical protein
MISNNDDEMCMNHRAQRSVETEMESEMLFKMAQQLPARDSGRNVPNSLHKVNSYKRGGVKSLLRASDFYIKSSRLIINARYSLVPTGRHPYGPAG